MTSRSVRAPRVSPGGLVNAVAAGIVAALVLSDLVGSPGAPDGGRGTGLLVGELVVAASCLTQLTGELLLARAGRGARLTAVAAVAVVTGLAAAALLFREGWSARTGCTDHCATDLTTGAATEAVAAGVACYALLTGARLLALPASRTGPAEIVVAVLAVAMPVAYTLATLLGTQ